MTTKVFIGLVTYPGSRYPEAVGPQGLASELSEALKASNRVDLEVYLEVCAENLLNPAELPTNSREVHDSINAELSVESDWRIYLDPKVSRIKLSLFMKARKVYRYIKFSLPWRNQNSEAGSGARMLIRLANIELAHISLLKSAFAAQADWVLILEDDAWVESPEALAVDLIGFLSSELDPRYVNLSESFSSRRLGIENGFNQVGSWGAGSKVFSATKPVTNTVCAILYSKTFIEDLLSEFESIPIRPVIPIDWKLNKAIMNLYAKGPLRAGDCWVVEPAPIVQGSMRPPDHSRVEK